MAEVPIIVALVAALIVAGYFCLRYVTLKRSIRAADRELCEIVENLEENRIVKLAAPDASLERLLGTVNRSLEAIRSEAVRYARREAELKMQIERISHDLRTPLTSILGYLALVDEAGLDAETRESLATVKRKAYSLQRLIAQFYDLSCVRSEAYRLDVGEVDVGRMVRESVASQYRLLEEGGLDVSATVSDSPLVAVADEAAVERVVANLVHNAGRYAQSKFEVFAERDGADGRVRIAFANDVDRFDESEADRLFEPFYTADSSRSQESSGLGLTIARQLAERMGGSLEAHVEERGGVPWLTFEVVLVGKV